MEEYKRLIAEMLEDIQDNKFLEQIFTLIHLHLVRENKNRKDF